MDGRRLPLVCTVQARTHAAKRAYSTAWASRLDSSSVATVVVTMHTSSSASGAATGAMEFSRVKEPRSLPRRQARLQRVGASGRTTLPPGLPRGNFEAALIAMMLIAIQDDDSATNKQTCVYTTNGKCRCVLNVVRPNSKNQRLGTTRGAYLCTFYSFSVVLSRTFLTESLICPLQTYQSKVEVRFHG